LYLGIRVLPFLVPGKVPIHWIRCAV